MSENELSALLEGINRNIVECKVLRRIYLFLITIVLIETLWNVKRRRWNNRYLIYRVLIETLWNVKSYRLDFSNEKDGY